MMRVLWAVVLLVVAGAAQAWPWTKPEDCQREHATKALGQRSLAGIYNACTWAYGENQTARDSYKGKCVIDRIDEPKSEAAVYALFTICEQEAVAEYPPPPPKPVPQLPAGCQWDEGVAPGMFDHISDADAFAAKVEAQAERCKARSATAAMVAQNANTAESLQQELDRLVVEYPEIGKPGPTADAILVERDRLIGEGHAWNLALRLATETVMRPIREFEAESIRFLARPENSDLRDPERNARFQAVINEVDGETGGRLGSQDLLNAARARLPAR